MQKMKKIQQDETKYNEGIAQKEQEQQVNVLASTNYIEFGIMFCKLFAFQGSHSSSMFIYINVIILIICKNKL